MNLKLTKVFQKVPEVVQRPPDSLARAGVTSLRRQLQRQRLATPPRPAPAEGRRRPLKQSDERTLPTAQLGLGRNLGRAVQRLPSTARTYLDD
jgi:hypothetical protein